MGSGWPTMCGCASGRSSRPDVLGRSKRPRDKPVFPDKPVCGGGTAPSSNARRPRPPSTSCATQRAARRPGRSWWRARGNRPSAIQGLSGFSIQSPSSRQRPNFRGPAGSAWPDRRHLGRDPGWRQGWVSSHQHRRERPSQRGRQFRAPSEPNNQIGPALPDTQERGKLRPQGCYFHRLIEHRIANPQSS